MKEITVTPSIRRAYPRTMSDKKIVCHEKAQVILDYMRLMDEPMTCRQLSTTFSIPEKTMVDYMRRLREKNLITRSEREGSQYFYYPTDLLKNFI